MIYIIFGMLCVIYYLIIWGYTGRKNSTFSIFWLLFGLFNLLLGFALPNFPQMLRIIINSMTLLILVLFLGVEVWILSAITAVVPEKLEYLIVLGAQVRGVNVTNSLKRRLDQALQYAKSNPDVRIIVSGGQGKGEDVPEAQAMKEYLVKRGVNEAQVLAEAKSRTTRENLLFSKRLCPWERACIGIVTNNFHVFRALQIGKKLGYQKLYGLSASSNPVLFVNYIVREGFGVIRQFFWQRPKKER